MRPSRSAPPVSHLARPRLEPLGVVGHGDLINGLRDPAMPKRPLSERHHKGGCDALALELTAVRSGQPSRRRRPDRPRRGEPGPDPARRDPANQPALGTLAPGLRERALGFAAFIPEIHLPVELAEAASIPATGWRGQTQHTRAVRRGA
jgi:hypothetical protein